MSNIEENYNKRMAEADERYFNRLQQLETINKISQRRYLIAGWVCAIGAICGISLSIISVFLKNQ
jgi:hypothetical protein